VMNYTSVTLLPTPLPYALKYEICIDFVCTECVNFSLTWCHLFNYNIFFHLNVNLEFLLYAFVILIEFFYFLNAVL